MHEFGYLERSCAELIESIDYCKCAFKPGISDAKISKLEKQAGITVPAELRKFYRFSYGATLCEYQIITIVEIAETQQRLRAVYRPFQRNVLPIACVIGVGDYIALDLDRSTRDKAMVLDGFHEFGPDQWADICFGLEEWLQRLAANRFEPFWLGQSNG